MRFEYIDTAKIEEAVSFLAKYGKKAVPLAGGTDVVRQILEKRLHPEFLINLGEGLKLDYLKSDSRGGIQIGALTTIRRVEESQILSRPYIALRQAAASIGSTAIRNVATVGGNLCNAAPCADMAPALMCLSAEAHILGVDKERFIPLENFFMGPGQTVLATGEILKEIRIPEPLSGTESVYLKHTRSPIDLALVGVAIAIVIDENLVCNDIRIVLGAVAPTPLRASTAEALLRGKKITHSLIDECACAAATEAKPITDVRAEAEYRRTIIKVLTRRGLEQTAQTALAQVSCTEKET